MSSGTAGFTLGLGASTGAIGLGASTGSVTASTTSSFSPSTTGALGGAGVGGSFCWYRWLNAWRCSGVSDTGHPLWLCFLTEELFKYTVFLRLI